MSLDEKRMRKKNNFCLDLMYVLASLCVFPCAYACVHTRVYVCLRYKERMSVIFIRHHAHLSHAHTNCFFLQVLGIFSTFYLNFTLKSFPKSFSQFFSYYCHHPYYNYFYSNNQKFYFGRL